MPEPSPDKFTLTVTWSRSEASDPDDGVTVAHGAEVSMVQFLVRSPPFQSVTIWLAGLFPPCVPEKVKEVGDVESAIAGDGVHKLASTIVSPARKRLVLYLGLKKMGGEQASDRLLFNMAYCSSLFGGIQNWLELGLSVEPSSAVY